jgi:hypothetical protein
VVAVGGVYVLSGFAAAVQQSHTRVIFKSYVLLTKFDGCADLCHSNA